MGSAQGTTHPLYGLAALSRAPRLALSVLALAVAAPAAAQTPPGYLTPDDLAVAEAAARQREVALENRLNAMDATRRAEEAVRTLREQAAGAVLSLTPPIATPRRPLDLGAVAAIPDSRLAASNARVKAAAANRR